MLIGRPYYPFDRELVLERQRCNLACWKFNNLTNPTTGVSVAERARLFRDILQPREGVQLTATQTTPVTHSGRVGDNTTVETPFNCDYGYNIHIGSNVLISRNCLINDVCEVRIGNNVIISPNVCIYTRYMQHGSYAPRGQHRPAARPSDCHRRRCLDWCQSLSSSMVLGSGKAPPSLPDA